MVLLLLVPAALPRGTRDGSVEPGIPHEGVHERRFPTARRADEANHAAPGEVAGSGWGRLSDLVDKAQKIIVRIDGEQTREMVVPRAAEQHGIRCAGTQDVVCAVIEQYIEREEILSGPDHDVALGYLGEISDQPFRTRRHARSADGRGKEHLTTLHKLADEGLCTGYDGLILDKIGAREKCDPFIKNVARWAPTRNIVDARGHILPIPEKQVDGMLIAQVQHIVHIDTDFQSLPLHGGRLLSHGLPAAYRHYSMLPVQLDK